MSKVAKRERIETETSEPLENGGYQTRCYEQHAWACLGCGLVWTRRSHAQDCESRGHQSSFEDGPYGVTHVENGRLMGNPHYFTRRAIRRETSKANLPSNRQRQAAAEPAARAYDADDKAFDAWVEHIAALRVPKDTSVVPAWKAQGILPNERGRLIDRMSPAAQRLRAQALARREAEDRAADREIERQMSAEPWPEDF